MKMKKVISYILYIISLASILIASGIKDVKDWWIIAKPFFAVWFICLAVALTISNINNIRRLTYPLIICFSAWLFNHKILITKFTLNTHRVYRMNNNSYKKLFEYTQNMFDMYLKLKDETT